MISFAPNVSWLLPNLPFPQRLQTLAEAGFEAIEFGFPSHADIDQLQFVKDTIGLKIVLFNQDVPVWDASNRGYLVDPKRQAEYHRTLDRALEIAQRLEVEKIMLPAGIEVPEMNRDAMRACMIQNLEYAAALADDAGVILTIEVLNPFDNPGYFLTSSEEAFQIIETVNHPRIRFQLDTYHLQMMEAGSLEKIIRAKIDLIGHIQFADYPGRHEPGTGELDFNQLLNSIEAAGYSGYIGLEYIPLAEGLEALSWIPSIMQA
jgi:hydroxypyruvate isomerase